MDENLLAARIVIAVAIANLLFLLVMLAFNIVGIPLGLNH